MVLCQIIFASGDPHPEPREPFLRRTLHDGKTCFEICPGLSFIHRRPQTFFQERAKFSREGGKYIYTIRLKT